IIKILQKKYKIKIWREKPFKILIATILSQRTKDEITRGATKKLFKLADTPEKILKLNEKEIEKLIKPVGFYRQKAKRIKKVAEIILKKHNGKVPDSRDELLKLPGVGFKTADVVLCYGFKKDVVPVDTHVAIIARRLKLTNSKDPEKIREELHEKIPRKYRRIFNLLMVEFGKDICKTAKPRCETCHIKNFCPSKFLIKK
ncbi:MAG: endonuclease III, partial [Candidatus Aenigmatarchaeota archaeon]